MGEEKKTWRRGAKFKSHIVGYGRTSKGTVVTPKTSIRASVETMRNAVINLLNEQIPDWEEALVELVYFDKDHKVSYSESKIVHREQ